MQIANNENGMYHDELREILSTQLKIAKTQKITENLIITIYSPEAAAKVRDQEIQDQQNELERILELQEKTENATLKLLQDTIEQYSSRTEKLFTLADSISKCNNISFILRVK